MEPNQTLHLDKHSYISYNITEVHISNLSLDGAEPIVLLGENELTLEISNLHLAIEFDFEMLMTTPILADIGTFTISLDGLSLSTLFNTSLASQQDNQTISVELKNFYLDFEHPGPLIDIDGYNDFGQVVNGTGNTLLAIIRNRLVSLI